MYHIQINEYIKKPGQAKELTKQEALKISGTADYLPHHRVLNVSKSGKAMFSRSSHRR